MFLLQSLEDWDYGPWLACMCIFLLYTRRLVCHGWGGLVLYLPVPVHRHRIDTARRYDAVTIFLIFLQYSSGCEVTCFFFLSRRCELPFFLRGKQAAPR